MLDHDHGNAEVLLDVLDPESHALGLFNIQSGGRFIQQQQLRFDAQGAAQFHDLPHAIREVGDQRIAVTLQAEERDDILHLLPMRQFGLAD
jgi:hypothetical protein